jgi:hypothetical protein
MKPQNELAMIVAFYLSKFGEDGLARLGFKTYKRAFEEVDRSLNVKPNSVKNWRDEFDPYYDTGRKGWYRQKIRPSRHAVMMAFDDLSESALRAIISDIIRLEARPQIEADLQAVLKEIKASDDRKSSKKKTEYVARGPTGRMAEEFFISRFHAGLTPFSGILKDCRDDGVGFDFEVTSGDNKKVIEVKGLTKESGSVTFTDKEWRVANEIPNNYFLGIVIQIPTSPKIGFVQNPASNFVAAYHAYTTITINWTISTGQLNRIEFI